MNTANLGVRVVHYNAVAGELCAIGGDTRAGDGGEAEEFVVGQCEVLPHPRGLLHFAPVRRRHDCPLWQWPSCGGESLRACVDRGETRGGAADEVSPPTKLPPIRCTDDRIEIAQVLPCGKEHFAVVSSRPFPQSVEHVRVESSAILGIIETRIEPIACAHEVSVTAGTDKRAGILGIVSQNTPTRIPPVIAIGSAVAIGAMTAIQARINGVLGVELQDGIVAGLVSFVVGLIAPIIVVLIVPSARAGATRLFSGIKTRTIPPWMLFGGVCGALTVSTQGLVAGVLGVALFTVGVVAGQTIHGLVLDRLGVGPAGVVAVTPGRVVGGFFVLAAVGISLSGDALTRAPLWMLLLPFAAGAGIAWQTAANGRLAKQVQSPLAAAFMSFIAGTIVLIIAAGISVLVSGPPAALPTQPWLYAGGILGFAYILLGAFIVAHTGVLLLALGSVLGQLVTSVVIDLIWPPVAGVALWQIVAMVAVALCGVLAAVWRRRR